MYKKGRSIRQYKSNWLVVAGILLVLVSIYGTALFSQERDYKEVQLMFELQAFRNAVIAFHYMNGRLPNNLEELANSSFIDFKGNSKTYLPQKIREQKEFKDPFGQPYIYDPGEGWVKTNSSPYASW